MQERPLHNSALSEKRTHFDEILDSSKPPYAGRLIKGERETKDREMGLFNDRDQLRRGLHDEPQFYRTIFQADMGFLERMIDWVRKVTRDCPFSVNDRRKIELALEEAFVNVVNHAYRGTKPPITARVEMICCKHPNRQVVFKIIDRGMPFNPLLQPKHTNPALPIEERQAGGLGIFFMKRSMDEVHYERHRSFNVLTLVKHAKRQASLAS